MSKIKKQNQIHQPRPKKYCVDKIGNDKNRLWLKSGTATMLFTENLSKNAIKALITTIDSKLKILGGEVKGNWLITK